MGGPSSSLPRERARRGIGTRLDAAIIFDRYRRTAALADIWFYHQHSLLAFWPFLDREVQEALREIQE